MTAALGTTVLVAGGTGWCTGTPTVRGTVNVSVTAPVVATNLSCFVLVTQKKRTRCCWHTLGSIFPRYHGCTGYTSWPLRPLLQGFFPLALAETANRPH